MADKFMEFLDDLGDNPVVESARQLYKAIYEYGFYHPLTVPDSIKQNAMMVQAPAQVVSTANGTSAPDNLGVDKIQNTNHRCTRDPNETAKEDWKAPSYKKQTVATSLPIRKMIERAQEHLPNPMVMGVPYSTQPMTTGYTINSNWTNKTKQGVFVGGDAGGGGGGGSSGGAS